MRTKTARSGAAAGATSFGKQIQQLTDLIVRHFSEAWFDLAHSFILGNKRLVRSALAFSGGEAHSGLSPQTLTQNTGRNLLLAKRWN
jgi:hypothetical protein